MIKPPKSPNFMPDDPFIKEFTEYCREICPDGDIPLNLFIQKSGWEILDMPWGYDLPFSYIHKVDGKTYICFKVKLKQ